MPQQVDPADSRLDCWVFLLRLLAALYVGEFLGRDRAVLPGPAIEEPPDNRPDDAQHARHYEGATPADKCDECDDDGQRKRRTYARTTVEDTGGGATLNL